MELGRVGLGELYQLGGCQPACCALSPASAWLACLSVCLAILRRGCYLSAHHSVQANPSQPPPTSCCCWLLSNSQRPSSQPRSPNQRNQPTSQLTEYTT